MAGPSVAVRIFGDLSQWAKSVSGAGDTAETGGKRISGAFKSVFSTLNQTGVLGPFGATLAGVGDALDEIGNKTGSLGTKLLGAGGAIAGIGLGLQAFGSAQAQAQQQLQVAIENTGGTWEQYAGQISTAVKAEEGHGETASSTMQALQSLTQVMHSPTLALQALSTASDIAAAKHEDLGTAATALGKAYQGNTKTLKQFGITTKESGTDALTDLANVTKGQADAAINTFTGHLDVMKVKIEDSVSTFANKYGPAITTAGAAMTGLGAAIEIVKGITELDTVSKLAHAVASGVQAAASGIATAAQWAFNAAMDANPIMLVVLAIGVLVAAFVEAYQHVSWFRQGIQDLWSGIQTAFDAIKSIVMGVFNWLKTNWPLVLGILTGPFGLLLEQVITHWNTVEDFLKSVPGRIMAIFAAAATWLVQFGDDIWRGLVNGLGAAWSAVSGFFEGIPGRIGALFSGAATWLVKVGENIVKGLGNGIKNAAGDAVKQAEDMAKSVVSAPLKLLHIGSPSKVFAEMGQNVVAGFVQGLQTGATDAAAAITNVVSVPAAAPALASSSPAVQFGDVYLADPVDVDLLAQKVAAVFSANRV